MNGGKTGHPPGLLQDDCRKLHRWFASRLDARHVIRKNFGDQMNNYEQTTQGVIDAFKALCKGRVEDAVKAEREACAAVCYRHAAFVVDLIDRENIYQCAAAIRARSNT